MFRSAQQALGSTIGLQRMRAPLWILQSARLMRHRKEVKLPPPPMLWKRLDCAIFGQPNVGKSVLLNALVKEKLAATNRKRHTTRNEILGVFNDRNTQLVFLDTPGYITKNEANKQSWKALRETTTASIEKADVVILVIDAVRKLTAEQKFILSEMVRLAKEVVRKEIILVLNKVDLVQPKRRLLDITREVVSVVNGVTLGTDNAHLAQLNVTTFMISALQSDGLDDLKGYLMKLAEPRDWLIPKQDKSVGANDSPSVENSSSFSTRADRQRITTLTDEQRVEEIVLEQLLDVVHDEIPYNASIRCTSIQQVPNSNKLRVDVDIMVQSPRQARIVVGFQGHTLLKIRQETAKHLESIFPQQTVFVYLWIKVDKKSTPQSLTKTLLSHSEEQ